MKKRFWNSEKLLGLSALTVSLLTLIVFIYQTNLIRKQQYLSVYPHLHLSNIRSGALSYQFILANNGIGPAVIKEVKITKGDSVYADLVDYVDEMDLIQDSVWYLHSNLVVGRLIPAEAVILLIQMADETVAREMGVPPNTVEGSRKLYGVLNADDLEISITYESVYGERWILRNDGKGPEKQ